METGKLIILAGTVLVIVGLMIQFGPQIPFLGKLPGDIRIEREGFSFYFPLTTSILLSFLLSVILWFFRR
ncbi:MAG: DUF2905 domain-containing protein [Patescibacteria group bacterium]|nr:DUF2905 domain-containing protein [Patescibacteria group bacterium]